METSTFYPDAPPETSSIDGIVREDNEVDWQTIRSATGNSYSSDTTHIYISVVTGDIEDKWLLFQRGIILFDTSSIPDDHIIDSAVFSIYGNYKDNDLSLSDNSGAICLTSSNPASNTSLQFSDYSTIGTTEFATRIGYSSFKIDDYNDFLLNNDGIKQIDKTGVSKFGLRLGCDLDDNEPAWSERDRTLISINAAKIESNIPKLVVKHEKYRYKPDKFGVTGETKRIYG